MIKQKKQVNETARLIESGQKMTKEIVSLCELIISHQKNNEDKKKIARRLVREVSWVLAYLLAMIEADVSVVDVLMRNFDIVIEEAKNGKK